MSNRPTANSSPPRRATRSWSRSTERKRLATSHSSASPILRPSVSLISLKRFRSMNSTQPCSLLRWASTVAHKLLASLAEPFLIDGHDLRVGGSIGISVYPQDGADAEALLRLADIAMYRAKQGGDANGDHDHVAFYSQDMNQGMQERMRIETGLRHALGHGQLLLHYQPKFCISSGRIIGAEALVRWHHPERGLVPPAEFIPLAEATGLVVQVGEWVLEAACAQAQRS